MRTNKLYIAKLGFMALLVLILTVLIFMPTVKAEEVEEIHYNSVQGPSLFAMSHSSLSFTRKEVLLDVVMAPKTPNYYDLHSTLSNGCAAIAGGIIVGYYDRTLENIVQNYSTVIDRGGNIVYKPMESNMQSVMTNLFDKMKVNIGELGATEDDFKNGLREYVTGKGYQVIYNSFGNGSNIDYNAVSESLKSGQPVALFVKMSNIVTGLDIGDNKLNIENQSYNTNHIMVVNGIKRVRYYNGNSVIRTDTYLSVSSGLKQFPSGYFWVEDNQTINDIVGVVIK